MRVLVRDEGRRAQMTLEDGDNVKNWLFALPAIAGAAKSAVMALAPKAKKMIESVAKKHVANVARAALETQQTPELEAEVEELENEGESLEDYHDHWHTELGGTYDASDPTEIHARVSADGRTIEMTFPYADLAGAEQTLAAIDAAAREAGLEIAPGDEWHDGTLAVGDVEVKHFMPIVAGLAGSLLGKGGVVGKVFKGIKGLFGKKKKKKRRGRRGGGETMQVAPGLSTSAPPERSPLEALLSRVGSVFAPQVAQPAPAIGSVGPGGGIVQAMTPTATPIEPPKPMWGSSGTPWPVGPGAPPAPIGEPIRPVSMIQNVISNTWVPAAPVSARAAISPVPVNPTQPMHPERIVVSRSESDETVTYYNPLEVQQHLDYAGGQHYVRDSWGE